MKLDVTCMRYLEKDHFRVLTAIEMGMRNHELVPVELITIIAKLRNGGTHKILSALLRHKLIAHANEQYDGYRLSYLGFDILALKTLLSRGVIASVGSQIGVGKESDIFEARNPEGDDLVIKIHRLGRTSFRAIRRQRDYMKGKSKASWLYMSRLAAIKEFAFMKALHEHHFPTPVPFDQNRHIVAMSRINGFPMAQIKTGQMNGAEDIFYACISILKRLAETGLIHCDFNEFNLMIDNKGTVTMIDFPQMVSTSHPNAIELYNRDVNGLVKFFGMKMRYIPPESLIPKFEDIIFSGENIDEKIKSCGKFSKEDDEELVRYITFQSDIQSAPNLVFDNEIDDNEREDTHSCESSVYDQNEDEDEDGDDGDDKVTDFKGSKLTERADRRYDDELNGLEREENFINEYENDPVFNNIKKFHQGSRFEKDLIHSTEFDELSESNEGFSELNELHNETIFDVKHIKDNIKRFNCDYILIMT